MPDPEDSLGGETFSGEEQQDPAEQSLGDGSTLGGGDTSSLSDTTDGDGKNLAAGLPVIDLGKRFEIESELGKGGMGAVLLARDKSLGRQVAIKRILGTMIRSSAAVNRFITEAKSIAALNHHNIVQIYEFGQDADGPLIVFEYVSGGSLLDRLKKGKLEPEEAIRITAQLCDALTIAHAKGIIHRDIKPANILMTEDGVAKLTDFGLAKQQNTERGQTEVGAIMGTIDFMPPEQKRDSSSVDARSDLWSLAAVCYQMLTGKTPKVIRERDIPVNMRDLLIQALEEDPADRFQSAMEMREAILQAHSGKMDTSRTLAEGECPQCATPNPSHGKFCVGCGTVLQIQCLECEAEIQIWNRACGECGSLQQPLVDKMVSDLKEIRDEAESLLAELEFDAAEEKAAVIVNETDSRLQQFAAWYADFGEKVRTKRNVAYKQLEEQVSQALEHEENCDYEASQCSLNKVDKRLEDHELENLGSAKSIRARITTVLGRIKRLSTANDTAKERAGALLEKFDFDKAIEAASEIEDYHPHLKEYAAWLDEFGEEVQSKRNAAYKQLEEQLSQALEHEENFDYEAGLESLGQVNPALKQTTISGIEDTAEEISERLTTKHARFKELDATVYVGVTNNKMIGLLAMVEELLKLKPDHPDAQKLKEQLEKREAELLETRDATIKQAKQQIEKQQYAEALATLDAVDDEVLDLQLKELKVKASELHNHLNNLHERVMTAVAGNQLQNLLPIVEECLTLKGDQDDLVKLKQDLISRDAEIETRNQQIIQRAQQLIRESQFDQASDCLATTIVEFQIPTAVAPLMRQAERLSTHRKSIVGNAVAALSKKRYKATIRNISDYLMLMTSDGIEDLKLEKMLEAAKNKESVSIRNNKLIKLVIVGVSVVIVLVTGSAVKIKLDAVALETAIGNRDWETALVLDSDNVEGLRIKAEAETAAAVTSAVTKGDWKAVLDLDPDNSDGLLLKHAAETSARITSALVKGDWKTLLDLDPDNIDGLRLRVAAERAAAVAADKAAAEILARAPITNIIGMTLKEIPAGTFKMGAGLLVEIDTFKDVQHTVTISKAFYMQTTEVTQGQWNAVMGSEPWEGKDSVREGPIYPAVYVSRDDAVAFCEKLSEKESTTYRLPTEAEWEYACRSGTKTSGIGVNYEKEFGDYAWCDENSRDAFGEQTAHEVGLKMPNAFGLYDMLGNVYEWCHDYYGEDYYKQSPEMDPMGPSSGSSRVLRGGSYTSSVFSYTHRSFADNGRGSYLYDIGFRVVRELK